RHWIAAEGSRLGMHECTPRWRPWPCLGSFLRPSAEYVGPAGWPCGCPGESVAQGRTSGDAKFREDMVQVAAHGPRRQEQSLGDLLVGQPGCGQQCDLPLLGCQWRA